MDVKFLVTFDADGAIKNMKAFDGQLDGIQKDSEKAGLSFKKLAGTFAVGNLAADAARKAFHAVTGELGASVKAAVDAAETHSKFGVVFSDVSARASAAAADLASNWGLSKQAAEAMLSSTGDLLAGLGLTGSSALSLSAQTQKLAIDLASFTNFSGGAEGASQALTKAMLGERESIKALGIVISEEMVKEELLKRGKQNLTGVALYQAKAEATLAIAMAQSKNAIGDYARTQDSQANSIKRINALMDDMRVATGNAILQTMGPAITKLKDWMDKNGETAARTLGSIINGFATAAKTTKDAVDIMLAGVAAVGRVFASVDQNIQRIADGWRNLLILVTDELGATYDKLGVAIERENAQTMKSISRFREMAQAAGLTGEQIRELSKKYKEIEDPGVKHERMLRELTKLYPDLTKKLQAKAQAQEKAAKTTGGAAAATLKDVKAQQELYNWLRKIIPCEVELAETNKTILEPSIEGATGELINMDAAISKVNANAKKSFSYMAGVVQEFWAKYGQAAQDAIYAVDAVVIQSHKNKEIKLDNEYKKAVERIQQSKMNEEEKAAAMAALDEEYDKKRSALKAKQANQDKLMSIVQATISTYEGAAKAFAQGGIFGHIFGAIIIAAGLALVAKIKAQPIPLAKGAIYTQPTILPGLDGQDRLVGEAGTEIVATPENIRKALKLDRKGGGAPAQGSTFYMTVPIYIGRDKIQEVLLKIVHDGASTGRLTIHPKAVR